MIAQYKLDAELVEFVARSVQAERFRVGAARSIPERRRDENARR